MLVWALGGLRAGSLQPTFVATSTRNRSLTKDLRSYFVWLDPEAGLLDPTMESRSVNGQ